MGSWKMCGLSPNGLCSTSMIMGGRGPEMFTNFRGDILLETSAAWKDDEIFIEITFFWAGKLEMNSKS